MPPDSLPPSEEACRDLIAKIEAEQARRSGSSSFSAFVRQAWQYCPQVEPLYWSWHMDALCFHYEAVARGEIAKLLANLPPGHAKSVLLAVLLPAWVWSWWAECQIMAFSYSKGFATRDSVRCRAVIESDWYRATHMQGWRLRSDQNVKTWFMNTRGGERHSTSIKGEGAGIRAHLVIGDDPLNISDATSAAAREEAKEFIGATLSQRFVDARKPRIAMVMQRLHEDDPSGFVLAGGGWEHLCLPSEFDPDRRSITRRKDGAEIWRDPRTERGELLFPERFPREVLQAFRAPNSLGEAGYAGQHQQQPRPEGGGMFKEAWWKFWREDARQPDQMPRPSGCSKAPAVYLPAKLGEILISVDANFRDKAGADPVSIQAIATCKADRYVLERISGPLGFGKTVAAIRAMVHRMKERGHRVRRVLIEARANGDAIIETLKDEIPGIIGIDPEGGKEARAWAIQPYAEAGNLYLPDGAPWIDEYVNQFASFPNGSHDDDVDALSQAIIHIDHGELTTAQRFAGGGRK